MKPLPTLFISHGSPMHAIEDSAAAALWRELGARLRPKAVVIASAHWETELPMVATGARPETIHDFGGFPRALYEIRYDAPGAPEVAQRAAELLKAAGLPVSTNACRGRDHGTWVPLRHMYPAADVPAFQVSIQPALGGAHHLALGAALAPLAREGVLIVGSGHMTHNLREWMQHVQRHGRQPGAGAATPYVEEFRRFIDAALRSDDRDALAQWEQRAPHALRAHPSPEHFLPLHVAYGAAAPHPQVERLDPGTDAGMLAMDCYLFTPRHA
jgi:4,5-DOPA dioxygenase extradiol